MKEKVLRASKKIYWYNEKERCMIGKIRSVVWSKSRRYKLLKNPIKWFMDSWVLEDKEKSTKMLGLRYEWKDIKIVSLWGKTKGEG